MTTERTAWLVVGVAGTASGVIAGVSQGVTASAVVAICAVAGVAAGLVSRMLHAEQA
jgi:hypothetical protein